jgi:hypothetical protein
MFMIHPHRLNAHELIALQESSSKTTIEEQFNKLVLKALKYLHP